MAIVRSPLLSLACVTCTNERICDGVALAQIAGVRAPWPIVRVATRQGWEGERCKRDESARIVNARTGKLGNSTDCPRCMSTTGTLRPRTDLGANCWMTGRGANRSDNGPRTHSCDSMHTQANESTQPGAEIPAAAKPGKKNKDASSIEKSDMIWCATTL